LQAYITPFNDFLYFIIFFRYAVVFSSSKEKNNTIHSKNIKKYS